ncbi:MAG: primosomal protein N' [Cytophagales bacterium]|nr:primosomal protein N' [Cytophagales bacterium]MDW8383512.1 primosomal protein N' [Flammeovirgaceae bacterium]
METLYADVIVPIRVNGYFTYVVPSEIVPKISVGSRVIIEFGKKKIFTGLVAKLHHQKPEQSIPLKPIFSIWDERPILFPVQFSFWEWLADYYLCTLGEIMNQALPAGLKLSTESRLQINPQQPRDFFYEENFSETEWKIIAKLLEKESLSYSEIANLLETKNPINVIQKIVKKNAVLIFENVHESYRPKKETYVRLTTQYADSEKLEELFKNLSKKKDIKKEAVLLRYLSLVPVFSHPERNHSGISKKELLSSKTSQEISESALQTLIKKGVMESFEVVVSRLHEMNQESKEVPIELTTHQKQAYEQILNCFQEKNVCLLHGITGSGKTEIYIQLIQRYLANGNQVLFLVPEIVLTPQLVMRLRKHIGRKIGVYHHKYSDAEKTEIWYGVLNKTYEIVVGVRSAIFLPFERLGLIVIDEEHETTYKQSEASPRYQARDAAIMLATMHSAKVLLGSATPSIESYYQAVNQKFGLVKLTVRYANASPPEIILVNTLREQKMKQLKEGYARVVLDALQQTIQNKGQAIVFKNRRGYAPYVSCQECGWTPTCQYCSVSLTYHLTKNELRCHYCGYTQSVPPHCIECNSSYISPVGVGTQKIEDDLQHLLPHARIQRLDSDSTKNKHAHKEIIEKFENQEVDILVGTQMLTKGLDFKNVQTVVILGADNLLLFPDFRAHERTFQLLTQVSGRASRQLSEHTGKVYIQTVQPTHEVLLDVMRNDYESFYKKEIVERYRYHYPPFVRIIRIIIKSSISTLRDSAATLLTERLVSFLEKKRVLGPENSYPEKVRNYYQKNILIKLERGLSEFHHYKKRILQEVQSMETQKEFRKVIFTIDVDAY